MNASPIVLAGRFRLARRLARGGMGELWIAEHLGLGAEVVIKLIAPEHLGVPGVAARFAAEAAAAARVNSPYVVKMIDYGVAEDGRPFIAMEKLEGRDLAAHLRASGRIAPELVARIVAQIASGLAKAHALGIVHRDVKPSNVFLCATDGGLAVKLLDFGVAKTARRSGETTTAGWLGTPAYMSPEQIVGASQVDPRSDGWSLGILAFECLTGFRPFAGETAGAIALAIHTQPTPKLTALVRSLPEGLDAWFARACAKEADERFASATALADALANALSMTRAATIDDATMEPAGVSMAPATITADVPPSLAGYTRSAAKGGTGSRRWWTAAVVLFAVAGVTASLRLRPSPQLSPPPEEATLGAQTIEPRPSTLLGSTWAARTEDPRPRVAQSPSRAAEVAQRTRAATAIPMPPTPRPSATAPADSVMPEATASSHSIFVMPDERH